MQGKVPAATVPIRGQRQRTDDSGSEVVPGRVHDGNIGDVVRNRVIEHVTRYRMSGFEQPRDHETVRRHGQWRKQRPDQFGGDCSLLGSSYLMELVAVRALAGNDVACKMSQPTELITCWAVVDRRTDRQTDVENAEAFDAVDDGKPQVFATCTETPGQHLDQPKRTAGDGAVNVLRLGRAGRSRGTEWDKAALGVVDEVRARRHGNFCSSVGDDRRNLIGDCEVRAVKERCEHPQRRSVRLLSFHAAETMRSNR